MKVYNKAYSSRRRKREVEARSAYYAELDVPNKFPGRRAKALPQTDRETWVEIGACYGTGMDFHSNDPGDIRAAIMVCHTCSVIEQCAIEQRALRAPGVWAGIHWRPSTGTFSVLPNKEFWDMRPRKSDVVA